MKKVLITGSNGYLGSYLTDYLSGQGYLCKGFDTGFFRNCLLYQEKPVTTKYDDVRNLRDIDLSGIDVVVHLAGISNDPVGKLNASQIYDPTRLYAFEVAKRCKRLGIKFIFASSCSIYGLGSDGLLTEDSDVSPQTFYSLNKLQIEQDLRSISDSDFSPIALRFATVFGPSPRIRFDIVINMLTGMAIADGRVVLNSTGEAWRPNIHIEDACQAIKCAIELNYSDKNLLVLNVGDEKNNIQIKDIAKLIQQEVPGCDIKFLANNPNLDIDGLIRDRKIKENGEDTRTYKVSFQRIREKMPEFKCKYDIQSGVRDLIVKLRNLNLTSEVFKSKKFYRLQELERLHYEGYISDDLLWLKERL